MRLADYVHFAMQGICLKVPRQGIGTLIFLWAQFGQEKV